MRYPCSGPRSSTDSRRTGMPIPRRVSLSRSNWRRYESLSSGYPGTRSTISSSVSGRRVSSSVATRLVSRSSRSVIALRGRRRKLRLLRWRSAKPPSSRRPGALGREHSGRAGGEEHRGVGGSRPPHRHHVEPSLGEQSEDVGWRHIDEVVARLDAGLGEVGPEARLLVAAEAGDCPPPPPPARQPPRPLR